jgi:hypothetical protein
VGLDGTTTTTGKGNQSATHSRSGGTCSGRRGKRKGSLTIYPCGRPPATYTSRQGLNQWDDVSIPPQYAYEMPAPEVHAYEDIRL